MDHYDLTIILYHLVSKQIIWLFYPLDCLARTIIFLDWLSPHWQYIVFIPIVPGWGIVVNCKNEFKWHGIALAFLPWTCSWIIQPIILAPPGRATYVVITDLPRSNLIQWDSPQKGWCKQESVPLVGKLGKIFEGGPKDPQVTTNNISESKKSSSIWWKPVF